MYLCVLSCVSGSTRIKCNYICFFNYFPGGTSGTANMKDECLNVATRLSGVCVKGGLAIPHYLIHMDPGCIFFLLIYLIGVVNIAFFSVSPIFTGKVKIKGKLLLFFPP